MAIAFLLLLAAAASADTPRPGTWRVETAEATCLATGWVGHRSSISIIFAREAGRNVHGAEDPAAAQIWIDGRRLPAPGAAGAIVAFDAPTWREETDVDRDALARGLATGARLQMRRQSGRIIATIPLAGAHRIDAELRRCVYGRAT